MKRDITELGVSCQEYCNIINIISFYKVINESILEHSLVINSSFIITMLLYFVIFSFTHATTKIVCSRAETLRKMEKLE